MDLLWALLQELLWKVNNSSDFFFFVLGVIYASSIFYLWVERLYSFLLWSSIGLLVFISIYYLLPNDYILLTFNKESILQVSIYFVLLFWILIQKNWFVSQVSECSNFFAKVFVFWIWLLFIPTIIIWLTERIWIFDIPNIFYWAHYMPFWEDLVESSYIYSFFVTNVNIIIISWITLSLFFMFFNKIFESIWWTLNKC